MDYDIEYYENMLRNYSKTAEQISEVRWRFISQLNPKTVLDYGSGVGWFRAFRPAGVSVWSYDIMPVPQTGIDLRMYDVVCFWDVLEHIPDFSRIEPVLALARHIAASLPLLPNNNPQQLSEWKHFKPGEHLHYFSHDTLSALMKTYGFVELKKGMPECPPREGIWSYLFAKQ